MIRLSAAVPGGLPNVTMALIFAADTVDFPDGDVVYVGNDVYMDNLSYVLVPEPAARFRPSQVS